jgi:ATP-dependent protease ClpP protease subunit
MKYLLVSLMFLGCAHVAAKPISLVGKVGVAVATQSEANQIVAELSKEAEQAVPTSSSSGPAMLEVDSFDEATMMGLKAKITELRQAGTEVWLRLNTNGGSVFAEQDFVQFLEHEPVTCVVDFRAFSAGAFFLESGACKERLMTKRSTVLFHEALVQEASGNSHALQDTVNELVAITDSIIATTSERLKMSEDDFKAQINNKVWIMSYHEALKANVVDKIVDPKDLPPVTAYEKPSMLQILLGKLSK